MTNTRNLIRIGLLIGLLVPFLDPPYFYFQLLRVSVTGGFIYLIVRPNQSFTQKILTAFFIVGCVLFQPIEKISLGKETWLIVDIIFSTLLLIDIIITNKKNNKKRI
jgi:hypothetical protein